MSSWLARPYLDSVPAGPGIAVAMPGGGVDDAPCLQRQIDAAAAERNGGIVFVRGGEYRIGKGLNVWRGVRLIGVGPGRARFTWAGGVSRGRAHMLHFRSFRDQPESDADNTTFFSGAFGLDFSVPAGVAAVRFRVAQHSLLRQCGFFLGPDAIGVEEAGHLIEECVFSGGRHGVVTGRTSASWPMCLRRCLFDGQRRSAVASSRAGLTVVESRFTRQEIVFAPHPEASLDVERLFARDCWFASVANCIVARASPSLLETALNLEHCVASATPVLLRFGDGTKTPGLGANTRIRSLRHGCHIRDTVAQGAVEPLADLRTETVLEPGPVDGCEEPAFPRAESLPEVGSWRDAHAAGAKGDGRSDDTDALQAAVEDFQTVYLPMGEYRLTRPLILRADTVLLGLHPGRTQLVLAPGTRAFTRPEQPRALLRTARGGSCVVRGVGLRVGDHAGAVGIQWRAGQHSLCEDVYFHAAFRARDVARERSHHSFLINDGGAGWFRNIWSADVAAESGLCVENTDGPVRGLMLSVEHHREREVWLRRARDIDLVALQTEENQLSARAFAVVIEDCSDVRVAQGFFYRVRSLDASAPQAVRVFSGSRITFENTHVFSWGPNPFVNTLFDEVSARFVRQRDFVHFQLRADYT